jgi:hypothetical protein
MERLIALLPDPADAIDRATVSAAAEFPEFRFLTIHPKRPRGPQPAGSHVMKTGEVIASFQTIMTLVQKGLRASATAEQRDEQLWHIEAEADHSVTRLLSAVVLS